MGPIYGGIKLDTIFVVIFDELPENNNGLFGLVKYNDP